MRDALDAAWGDFPTVDVGYDWLRYTGTARPTAAWVSAVVPYARVTFVQESYSTRSSEGYAVGVIDCRYAEQRAREVHPGVESIAVVVSDGNNGDLWDASEYARGWSDTATIPFFPYGDQPICESFLRGAHGLVLNGTWVPATWGTGTFLTQLVTPSPIANTDLNTVHQPYWPVTATPSPAPRPPTPKEAFPMLVNVTSDGMFVKAGWYYTNGVDVLRPVTSVNDYPQPYPVGMNTGHAADLLWGDVVTAQQRNKALDAFLKIPA